VPAVVPLPKVDRVEILTVLDLSLDLLMAGSETVRRATMVGTLGEGRSTLRAEHGFSSLVTVVEGGRKESFLRLCFIPTRFSGAGSRCRTAARCCSRRPTGAGSSRKACRLIGAN